MPIPLLIPVGIGAVALVSATAAVVSKKWPRQAVPQRVAIIGTQRVGKTTLLEFLSSDDLPAVRPAATQSIDAGAGFTLEPKGIAIPFVVEHDLPGRQLLGYHDWESEVDGAKHVWYLFRADLVADDDAATIKSMKKELKLLATWLSASNASKKVLLVGVCDGATIDSEIERQVNENGALKLAAATLGAKIILGSLASDSAARQLRSLITKNL